MRVLRARLCVHLHSSCCGLQEGIEKLVKMHWLPEGGAKFMNDEEAQATGAENMRHSHATADLVGPMLLLLLLGPSSSHSSVTSPLGYWPIPAIPALLRCQLICVVCRWRPSRVATPHPGASMCRPWTRPRRRTMTLTPWTPPRCFMFHRTAGMPGPSSMARQHTCAFPAEEIMWYADMA